MIQIAGRDFDDNLSLVGFENRVLRAWSVRHLIDGGCVDQSVSVAVGQEVILEATKDGDSLYGVFTGDDVTFLNNLRASGSAVLFVHHLGSWIVKIVGIDVVPLFQITNPDGDTEYSGRVVMLIKSA